LVFPMVLSARVVFNSSLPAIFRTSPTQNSKSLFAVLILRPGLDNYDPRTRKAQLLSQVMVEDIV
jgi:hypothetical protein